MAFQFQIPDEILDKYKGKSLEELFQNCEVVENEFGEFLKITDPFDLNGFGIKTEELKIFERILRSELQLVPGIGIKKSHLLRKRNITDISDMLGLYTKNFCEINAILSTISSKDLHQLRSLRKTHDEDFIFCVENQDLLFLDIETTGQSTAEVFLIGIGFYSEEKNRFQTELLFAREISEEAAVLSYFLELLPKYKMIITYNGRTFDIPFIRNRIATLFEPDDIMPIMNIIHPKDLDEEESCSNNIFEMANSLFNNFIHFDLYHAIRRNYKGLLPNYRLTTAEEKLLEFKRKDNLPSSEVPMAYKLYIEDSSEYIGGIFKTIEHNYYDVVNLERLLSSWMRKQIEEFYNVVHPNQTKNYDAIIKKLKKSRRKLRSFNLDPFLK